MFSSANHNQCQSLQQKLPTERFPSGQEGLFLPSKRQMSPPLLVLKDIPTALMVLTETQMLSYLIRLIQLKLENILILLTKITLIQFSTSNQNHHQCLPSQSLSKSVHLMLPMKTFLRVCQFLVIFNVYSWVS